MSSVGLPNLANHKNHSWTVASGRYSVQQFWTWPSNSNSDISHRCSTSM